MLTEIKGSSKKSWKNDNCPQAIVDNQAVCQITSEFLLLSNGKWTKQDSKGQDGTGRDMMWQDKSKLKIIKRDVMENDEKGTVRNGTEKS